MISYMVKLLHSLNLNLFSYETPLISSTSDSAIRAVP
jgi:hypothetical protein